MGLKVPPQRTVFVLIAVCRAVRLLAGIIIARRIGRSLTVICAEAIARLIRKGAYHSDSASDAVSKTLLFSTFEGLRYHRSA